VTVIGETDNADQAVADWHYELLPDAIDDGCPAMYADPTHDPRMQQ
jgi:hypothetical protein